MGWSSNSSGTSTPSKWGKHYGYNLTNGMSAYKTALSSVGSKIVSIHVVGDSVSAGDIAASGNGYADVLRTVMQNRYTGNTGNGFIGVTGHDAGSSWSGISGGSIAYQYLDSGATTTISTFADFVFTGTEIDVYYCADATGGAATVTIDGAAPTSGATTISFLNAGGFTTERASYTGLTNAQHTITFTSTGTGHIMFAGAIYRTATSGIELVNFSVPGKTASVYAATEVSSSWSALPSPSLAFIAFGYNDLNNSETVSQFEGYMGTLISAWQNAGASVCLLALPRPSETWGTHFAYNIWPDYVNAMYSLADTYDCGLIDLYQATMMSYEILSLLNYHGEVSETTWGPAGANPVHPGTFGHLLLARIIEPHII